MAMDDKQPRGFCWERVALRGKRRNQSFRVDLFMDSPPWLSLFSLIGLISGWTLLLFPDSRRTNHPETAGKADHANKRWNHVNVPWLHDANQGVSSPVDSS